VAASSASPREPRPGGDSCGTTGGGTGRRLFSRPQGTERKGRRVLRRRLTRCRLSEGARIEGAAIRPYRLGRKAMFAPWRNGGIAIFRGATLLPRAFPGVRRPGAVASHAGLAHGCVSGRTSRLARRLQLAGDYSPGHHFAVGTSKNPCPSRSPHQGVRRRRRHSDPGGDDSPPATSPIGLREPQEEAKGARLHLGTGTRGVLLRDEKRQPRASPRASERYRRPRSEARGSAVQGRLAEGPLEA